jgi:hypothetical protein
MTIQIKKTYRGLNPGMLYDEVQGLLQKHGIMAVETESQTYGLPSGDTQSRTTLALKTQAQQEQDQNVDETFFPQEKISAFEGDLDFILGSYEIKW